MKKITLIALMLFTALGYAQGIELNGTISAEDNQIKNLQDPTEAQDAVTKAYIDALIAEAVAGLQSQIDDLDTDTSSGCYGPRWQHLRLPYLWRPSWTVENAEMVTYRDGTPIPQVTDNRVGKPHHRGLVLIMTTTLQKASFIIGMP